MLDWFNFYGHVCISFELLSLSTFDFLKANSFLPYTLGQIRHMARQVCQAVRCESDCNVAKSLNSPSTYNTRLEKLLKLLFKKKKKTFFHTSIQYLNNTDLIIQYFLQEKAKTYQM